jgi:hypothetical protein
MVRNLFLGSQTSLTVDRRAISLNLFSAAILLVVEARFHQSDAQPQYLADIGICLRFLHGVKDQSVMAARAVEILEAQILEAQTLSTNNDEWLSLLVL